jgi:hypothetical protein
MNVRNSIYKNAAKTIFFVFCIQIAGHSASFKGIVIDKENSNKPIPGVFVSCGNTLNRTITDDQGRFSLEGCVPDPVSVKASFSTPFISISWNMHDNIMNFSQALGLTSISIFRLNGSRVFHAFIDENHQLVRLPCLGQGIFIIRASFFDNSQLSWKWTAFEKQGVFKGLARSRQVFTKKASSIGETSLLFRHDSYYPVNQSLLRESDSLIVEMKPDPRWVVFDPGKIHTYAFTLTDDDSLLMEKNARKEKFVPAEFSFDGVAFGKVGLRYKGSYYYSLPRCFDSLTGARQPMPECAKVSLKIKFSEYEDGKHFNELKFLNLHSMSLDPSKMHEMLSYRFFREMGMYTSRTAYAKVFINGVFRGLFLAVENFDGRFAKSRWPSHGDGNLYKEVWPISSDKNYYTNNLVTNYSSTEIGNVKRMMDFYKALKTTTAATFVRDISPFMDLDYWLRYIVVDRAVHNADGAMTWYYTKNWTGNHNYFFYEDDYESGKLWLCPWDLHETLAKTDPIVDDCNEPEWNVAPQNCQPVPVWDGSLAIPAHCDKLTGLTADVLWDPYVAAGEQFLKTLFPVQRTQSIIDTLKNLIDSVVSADPLLEVNRWRNEVKDLRLAMITLNKGFDDYIHKRALTIDPSECVKPIPDSGFLSIDRVNNFEFSFPPAPLSLWTTDYASPQSGATLSLDTSAPLCGLSDLRCSFRFLPDDTSKQFNVWSESEIFFRQQVDCRKLKQLRMQLKSDTLRYCRICLLSKEYENHKVIDAYGWDIPVGSISKVYAFDASTISYSVFGKQDNPDLLDSVLATTEGIGIVVYPHFSTSGKMTVIPDSGYIKIDNIMFDF